MNECLSGRSNYWGKPSAGTTYQGSYLQGQGHLDGGLSENSHSPESLFAVLVNFLLARRASSSRVWWCPWYPASHIPGGAAPISSLGPLPHLRLKPKPALTASTQAPKKAQLWPSNTAWRNHGRQERGWQTHNSRIVTPPPAPCRQTQSQTSGSSWAATPGRAPGRAAALSAWPEHQLLPLPGLSGIPSLPRGDCY